MNLTSFIKDKLPTIAIQRLNFKNGIIITSIIMCVFTMGVFITAHRATKSITKEESETDESFFSRKKNIFMSTAFDYKIVILAFTLASLTFVLSSYFLSEWSIIFNKAQTSADPLIDHNDFIVGDAAASLPKELPLEQKLPVQRSAEAIGSSLPPAPSLESVPELAVPAAPAMAPSPFPQKLPERQTMSEVSAR